MLRLFVAAAIVAVLSVLHPISAQVQDDTTAALRTQDNGADASQDSGRVVLQEVRAALSRGDAEGLIKRSAGRIDLTVIGVSELLSRSQARYVVRSFFADYPPARVEIVDTYESGGNWFASAGYWYENGPSPLSVYLRLRRGAGGWELRELRIDRMPQK